MLNKFLDDEQITELLSNCVDRIGEFSRVLSNAMINVEEIDKINHNLHYVQMQMHNRFMKH